MDHIRPGRIEKVLTLVFIASADAVDMSKHYFRRTTGFRKNHDFSGTPSEWRWQSMAAIAV
jgi:hypothetical protein